jgi:hypothetical protein
MLLRSIVLYHCREFFKLSGGFTPLSCGINRNSSEHNFSKRVLPLQFQHARFTLCSEMQHPTCDEAGRSKNLLVSDLTSAIGKVT